MYSFFFTVSLKFVRANYTVIYEVVLLRNFNSSPRDLLIKKCLMYSKFVLTDQKKNHTSEQKFSNECILNDNNFKGLENEQSFFRSYKLLSKKLSIFISISLDLSKYKNHVYVKTEKFFSHI